MAYPGVEAFGEIVIWFTYRQCFILWAYAAFKKGGGGGGTLHTCPGTTIEGGGGGGGQHELITSSSSLIMVATLTKSDARVPGAPPWIHHCMCVNDLLVLLVCLVC